MEQRVTPDFFYGSAIAALCGLLLGLMLHGAWEKHPGGPQLWSGSAAAEALIQPRSQAPTQPTDGDELAAAPAADDPQVADFGASHVEPDPLPVTRLDPDRFDPKPAAAGDATREDVDDPRVAGAPPAPAPNLD